MFTQFEELDKPIPNNPIVTIIDPTRDNIITNQIKSIDTSYDTRLTFIVINKVTELPLKEFKGNSFHEHGLVNTKWIKTITTQRPAVILYYHFLPQNPNPREEESKIINELKTIHSNNNNASIYLLVFTNGQGFSFEEDKDKSTESLKKYLSSKRIYISPEQLKGNELKKLRMSIVKDARDYYKTLKKSLRAKIEKSTRKELSIKYNIKLGILTILKTRKPTNTRTKYFEEAYKLLSEIEIDKYFYTEVKNLKKTYFEIKSAADWLYHKILKNDRLRMTHELHFEKFNQHMKIFSKFQYFEKLDTRTPGKSDIYYLYEFYWKFMRYNYFVNWMNKETIKPEINENFPAFYLMKEIYCIKRIIKMLENLNDIKLNVVQVDGKEKLISEIETERNKYFEKMPHYYILSETDPLNKGKKYIPFSEEILLKKFILENKITIENLNKMITETLVKNTLNYFDKANPNEFKGVNLYLHIINLFNETSDTSNDSIYVGLKSIYYQLSKALINFPKLYFTYMDKYTQCLIDRMNSTGIHQNEKQVIFSNLISTGNFRKLNEKEEEVLFKLINESTKNSESKDYIQVNSIDEKIFNNNKIFNFEYTISKDDNRKSVFELVEFTFKFSTSLSMQPIKFSYIEFIFEKERKPKRFSNFPNDLTINTPLILNYKLIIKDDEKMLILKRVNFSLEQTPNIVYTIKVYNENSKIITMKNLSKKVLDFQTPKIVKVGENELYLFECNIVKDKNYDMQIDNLNISFEKEIGKGKYDISINRSFSQKQNFDKSTPTPDSNSLSQTLSLKRESTEKVEDVEFYQKLENGKISEKQNKCEFHFENFEQYCERNGENSKISFLIRFKEKGRYTISFYTEYKIVKAEIEDESIILNDKGQINFEVINPLNSLFENSQNLYLSLSSQKHFPTEKKLKLNLVLTNKLDTNLIIKDVEAVTEKPIAEISTLLSNLINLDIPQKDSLLTILKSSDYTIPFDYIIHSAFSGSLGYVTLKWTTEKLKKFSETLYNTNTFILPEITAKPFSYNISYQPEKYDKVSNLLELNIEIENKENLLKKIVFLIDTTIGFYINGFSKHNIMIYPNEKKKINLKITPLSFGMMKLPPCKIMEYSIQGGDNKLFSIYYFPDFVQIDP